VIFTKLLTNNYVGKMLTVIQLSQLIIRVLYHYNNSSVIVYS